MGEAYSRSHKSEALRKQFLSRKSDIGKKYFLIPNAQLPSKLSNLHCCRLWFETVWAYFRISFLHPLEEEDDVMRLFGSERTFFLKLLSYNIRYIFHRISIRGLCRPVQGHYPVFYFSRSAQMSLSSCSIQLLVFAPNHFPADFFDKFLSFSLYSEVLVKRIKVPNPRILKQPQALIFIGYLTVRVENRWPRADYARFIRT